jgi:putative DNA primase/helicase
MKRDANDILREEGPDALREAFVISSERAKANGHQSALYLPPPSQPMDCAREYVNEYCVLKDGTLTVRYWRGGWWKWMISRWEEIEGDAMRASLYKFTEHAVYETDKGDEKQWAPTVRRVSDLTDALKAITLLPATQDQPCWLDERETGTIVAVGNGLLDIERRELLPHTPQYFNQTFVPFDYDASAPEPTEWLAFLGELWPNEPEAIDVLGEWFGYVFSGRLDLHKMMLMIGPTRGGKGLIGRILSALIGRQNVCGPTLTNLGGEKGLMPLIGKPLR